MTTKIIAALIILAIGIALMFGLLHYRGATAKQQAQVQCIQGDQAADHAAQIAQHQADLQNLAELQQQLERAQVEAAAAIASARAADTRAAKLASAFDALRKTDATVRRWSDERIPATLRAQFSSK